VGEIGSPVGKKLGVLRGKNRYRNQKKIEESLETQGRCVEKRLTKKKSSGGSPLGERKFHGVDGKGGVVKEKGSSGGEAQKEKVDDPVFSGA